MRVGVVNLKVAAVCFPSQLLDNGFSALKSCPDYNCGLRDPFRERLLLWGTRFMNAS